MQTFLSPHIRISSPLGLWLCVSVLQDAKRHSEVLAWLALGSAITGTPGITAKPQRIEIDARVGRCTKTDSAVRTGRLTFPLGGLLAVERPQVWHLGGFLEIAHLKMAAILRCPPHLEIVPISRWPTPHL